MKARKHREDILAKSKKKKRRPAVKKTYQVNVHFDSTYYARLQEAASIQQHSYGQLCRILVEWALPFYEKARSVESLKYLAIQYFTSLETKPLEQREPEMDLSLDYMVAGGGR